MATERRTDDYICGAEPKALEKKAQGAACANCLTVVCHRRDTCRHDARAMTFDIASLNHGRVLADRGGAR